MDKNKYEAVRLKMEACAEALRKNNFYCECADSKEEALEIIEGLIPYDSTVTVGGSMTLFECGVIDLLRNGDYNFLDRYESGITPERVREIYTAAFSSDVFLCSSNAITESGELLNIDGTGNRVAAMIYGPKSVIVVAGYNKIVKDIPAAYERVKSIAAPANNIRLSTGAPCTKIGRCCDCKSESRICADTVIMGHQRTMERIKVILVAEELGY